MAQSPEFPQYPWVPPKSYTGGRKSGQPSVIVIHTTEGSEGPNSAEDGAAYDQRRTDGTSAHFYVDSTGAVQCVRTTDEAHTARQTGNDIGIHLELCGKAGQSASQWADPVSSATVEHAAEVCRTLLGKYPNIPVVRLTPSQLRNGQRGFCGHVDISNAFGESDHTDPGPNFPWSRLFALINEEEVVISEDDANLVASKVWAANWPADSPALGSDGRETAGGRQRATHDAADQALANTQLILTRMDTPIPVEVDADAVADALAANVEFLANLAKAVNDDAARRLTS